MQDPGNLRNNKINEIVNITKQYLNIRTNKILAWDKRIVQSYLQQIEKETNK